jgi:hypothetical protein
VRVEIMGSQKCRIVGKSQSVLIMISPIISTRTRTILPVLRSRRGRSGMAPSQSLSCKTKHS